MVSLGIGEIIDAALGEESETHHLRKRLERKLPLLQQKLLLPKEEPALALMAFITGYVRSVPSCLRLVTAISKRFGFFDYAAPFLHLAEDSFLQPRGELPQDGGLDAVLNEAFLAHRLLEEVNDHHIKHLQHPLLPLDRTEANIIVHHLLGDEFATQLEELVQFTASGLLHREHVWEQARALGASQETLTPLVPAESLIDSAWQIRLRLAS